MSKKDKESIEKEEQLKKEAEEVNESDSKSIENQKKEETKKETSKKAQPEKEEDEETVESKVKEGLKDKSNNPFDILKIFFKELFDISYETDKYSTIEDIKSGINMKGQNAWVLIFSILICSTGLNTSSSAVVIGAMLISPLMGPILGIGLALAINDISVLKKAFKNFLVMVILSVLTSFIFFSVPIFQNETSEILARTSPTVLDVIIALSGGIALIIAYSRNNKSINTIAGVAIATALMPPLCTAGYGLAIGNWAYFGGALFLFAINSIFIATATFTIVKFLRFPMKKYADAQARKKTSRAVYTVVALVIIPSVFMFYKLYKKSDFKQKVESTLVQVEKEKGIGIFEIEANYSENLVSFAVLGKSLIENDVKAIKVALDKSGFPNVELKIIQEQDNLNSINRIKGIEKSFTSTQELLALKDNQLAIKERQVTILENQIKKNERFPFNDILLEMKSIEPNLVKVTYNKALISNFESLDTLRTIKVYYDKKVDKKEKVASQARLNSWLIQRVKSDSVKVVFE